jgi:small subunit ribosomal protein S8e
MISPFPIMPHPYLNLFPAGAADAARYGVKYAAAPPVFDTFLYVTPFIRRAGEILSLWQGRSRRKPSGGRVRSSRNKRKFEIGSEPTTTLLGKTRRKQYRIHGGATKVRIRGAEEINVYNPETKKTVRTKIITVKENAANPHFIQRNIITKGAMLSTDIGIVRVTSRPGQDGVINGVLEGKEQ